MQGTNMTSTAEIREMCRPFWSEIVARQPAARVWRKDHALWKPAPDEIINRLGWLDLPRSMSSLVRDLVRFARDVHERGIQDVILLGMGGSSLCAEVLRQTFGSRKGFPKLTVLDSTLPQVVRRVAQNINLEKTLFIVASKSGGTIEVVSLYRYFSALMKKACGDGDGKHFVAITDPGTKLLTMAHKVGFLRVFINPADVGGRYSALSYFGLVPAALMGLDINRLLARGREVARTCGVTSPPEENPGAWLGLCMGCLARAGRDKLTIVTSPKLAGFDLWAEQLVAESTGKDGRGVIPVAQEPFAPPDAYGDDRFFVHLRLADDDNEAADHHVEALYRAGTPVMVLDLEDLYDLGGEFFRWEYAVAIAGACLEINPFDQPNVQESKAITAKVLAEYERENKLPAMEAEGSLKELIESAQPGDYAAIMAFTAETPELNQAFDALRRKLLTEHKLPSTLGYGPRFLHSTGQLHKGGANNGLFLQIVCLTEQDLPVPGKAYSFGTLAAAHAIGDFNALKARQRRLARICVEKAAQLPDTVRALLA